MNSQKTHGARSGSIQAVLPPSQQDKPVGRKGPVSLEQALYNDVSMEVIIRSYYEESGLIGAMTVAGGL